jgi:DNA-binding transcriptional MerR regulator
LRRIGEVAEVTGLTQRTIRYYEELGLLEPAAHQTGGNRRYDDDDLERLKLIRRLKDVVGLSLSELREFLETESERTEIRRQYNATSDELRQTQLLERAAPILRRRVELLERKLAKVQGLLDEERTRLNRVRDALARVENSSK